MGIRAADTVRSQLQEHDIPDRFDGYNRYVAEPRKDAAVSRTEMLMFSAAWGYRE